MAFSVAGADRHRLVTDGFRDLGKHAFIEVPDGNDPGGCMCGIYCSGGNRDRQKYELEAAGCGLNFC